MAVSSNFHTAALMNDEVLLDVMLYPLSDTAVTQYSGGEFCLHLQRVS